MKLQIDTDSKVIRLEENVNLGVFYNSIRKMLPNAWSSFELDCTPIINWTDPTILAPTQPINPYPTYPWITWERDTTANPYTVNFNTGTYNIEL